MCVWREREREGVCGEKEGLSAHGVGHTGPGVCGEAGEPRGAAAVQRDPRVRCAQ